MLINSGSFIELYTDFTFSYSIITFQRNYSSTGKFLQFCKNCFVEKKNYIYITIWLT